jgi:hypothetical protein
VARTGPGSALLVTCACALLLAAGCVSYFGKERFHRFTEDEVSASRWLYDTAPVGSMLLSATYDYPWAWRNYERYEYFALEDATASVRRRAARAPAATLEALLHHDRRPGAYVVLTRTQEARVDMTGLMRRGTLQRMERALARDPAFVEVIRGPDASVFRLDPRGRG